jgi:hypothetical protein
MPDTVVIQRTLYPDSIEIGTPSKGGCVKVHFDAGDLVDAQRRIENAVNARVHMISKLAEIGVKTRE